MPGTLATLLRGFVWQHRWAYASSALMLLGIALLNVWIPRGVGQAVDAMVAQPGDVPLRPLVLLLLAGLGVYALRVAWRLALFGAAYRLGQGLRVQLLHTLAHQAPRYFQDQRSGDLLALATNDVDAVEQAAGDALLAGFDGSSTFVIVVLGMAVAVDWRLALAALLPFPFMAWAFWFISERVHGAWSASLAHFGQMSRQAQQGLTHIRTVRAMGLAEQEQAAFSRWAEASVQASAEAQRWEAAYEPAVGITLSLAAALVLGAGGWLVMRQELSVGQLTAFTMLLGQLIWPMFAAGWVLSLMERGRAAWARLAPVLHAPSTLVDEGKHAGAARAALTVSDLHFGYGEQTTLHGVSLRLAPGRMLAIVGPTGAGKTTLLRLLLRQWEPRQGHIALDGVPLPQWRRAALARAIAWVPQEPFLFSASVAENIALARPEASPAAVEEAARQAGLAGDLQSLPAGLQTLVGEKGVSLSGGQRQRVAIARALLSGAPLLLLDDALSAVDSGTETHILGTLRNLRQARPECALLVVTHRLSSAVEADEILVLHHGVITERGTHAELLAHEQGWYAAQWRHQQLEASLA